MLRGIILVFILASPMAGAEDEQAYKDSTQICWEQFNTIIKTSPNVPLQMKMYNKCFDKFLQPGPKRYYMGSFESPLPTIASGEEASRMKKALLVLYPQADETRRSEIDEVAKLLNDRYPARTQTAELPARAPSGDDD